MSARFFSLLFLLSANAPGAIWISGVVDKTKYSDSVTITVSADPEAATTAATLNGKPFPIDSPVQVRDVRYHELKVESRDTTSNLLDSRLVRFIIRNSARGSTEDGIPTFTPAPAIDDAPSAFAAADFRIIAPSSWPAGLPIPVAAVLRDAAGDPLRLNGKVHFGAFPAHSLRMRRGWGSVLAPAATSGPVQVAAALHGLADSPEIGIETSPTFTPVSGDITADTVWPAHSRIRVTGRLTIAASATLTLGEGSIVLLGTGNGSAGSGVEIVLHGRMLVNGTADHPVVFAPDGATGRWGGIELPSATSDLTATHAIFTGAGEDPGWFNTNSGYSTHRPEQALFLVSGSGSGTAIGARLRLSDCYCFGLGGQHMNSKTNTWIDLQRTLMQRSITCGELNGSKVTIDRSALIEFPAESEVFADADNDAIYLTNGDLSITRSVIGFCKDDGIDSGANGGDNPFTSVADTTPFVASNNWIEAAFHEGNSLSGTRDVSHTGSVFFNCGQGIEAGYSSSSTGNGPHLSVDSCLFSGNMVGVRWGDNYGSGYNYNGTVAVRDSFFLQQGFRDVFSGQWHPTQASAWIYQTTATNSQGRPYLDVQDSLLSQADPVNHPLNTAWNATDHAPQIEPFMPVPGSKVGVAVAGYEGPMRDITAFPSRFEIRLSTFSSKPVSVDWSVIGQSATTGESMPASGSLLFNPGEVVKVIEALVPSPESYSRLHLDLENPVNAEVTGEAWFFASPVTEAVLVPRGSGGWRYRETRSDPPSGWKSPGFDDSSPAATEWQPASLPAGFGVSGVSYGTILGFGPNSSDKTRTYYFRRRFMVDDASAVTSVVFRVRRDDAVVLWLNDDAAPTVISSSGTFSPPFSYNSLAPNSSDSNSYHSFTIPASKLVSGENLLAVELHQTSITSSDAIFDCELMVHYAPPFELHLGTSSGNPVLWWFDPDALLESSTELENWQVLPGARSPLTFAPGSGPRFYRLRK
ncbi:MAG: hypothetical protein MUF31_03170 [Akkermansiaceae bacterium]|jgi:hypothetical protein|nr:hypothetical protein [Akkermansiaceae bacterium]